MSLSFVMQHYVNKTDWYSMKAPDYNILQHATLVHSIDDIILIKPNEQRYMLIRGWEISV